MRHVRRTVLGAAVAALVSLAVATAAQASGPIQLVLGEAGAFSILGHSCGGIQEESFATGFAASGYPEGTVALSTRCGGSGRGGGGHTTTYTGAANVEWTWFGEVRSFSKSEAAGGSPTFEATDAHGDRLYQSGRYAYLTTGEPPFERPAAPTGVGGYVYLAESGNSEFLEMSVSWTDDPVNARLIASSTVTATPVQAGPTLSATTAGTAATLGPVQPNTRYVITVTSSDAEGTSEPSEPIELTSPNSDGEAEKEHNPNAEVCESISGTIKLSPGISETPHVQTVTVKGELRECGGPEAIESGTFVAHMQTNEEVSCSTLSSLAAEPTTTPLSLSLKWLPKEEDPPSHGSLAFALTEAGSVPLEGTIEGGPFSSSSPLTGTVGESFAGGPTCGLAEGKKKAKPVKSGTFFGGEVGL